MQVLGADIRERAFVIVFLSKNLQAFFILFLSDSHFDLLPFFYLRFLRFFLYLS